MRNLLCASYLLPFQGETPQPGGSSVPHTCAKAHCLHEQSNVIHCIFSLQAYLLAAFHYISRLVMAAGGNQELWCLLLDSSKHKAQYLPLYSGCSASSPCSDCSVIALRLEEERLRLEAERQAAWLGALAEPQEIDPLTHTFPCAGCARELGLEGDLNVGHYHLSGVQGASPDAVFALINCTACAADTDASTLRSAESKWMKPYSGAMAWLCSKGSGAGRSKGGGPSAGKKGKKQKKKCRQ